MMRPTQLSVRFLLASASLLLGGPLAPAARAADRPPNVILMIADDLGYAELGCYGQKIIETPNLDRLAADGMRFTQAYSGNAVCAPSRCCLMTGKHPGHAWVRNNGGPDYLDDLAKKYQWEYPGQHPIPDEEVTLAEVLKARGYATGAAGKWGLGQVGNTGDPNRQGFDLFFGYYCQGHAHNHYPRFLWRSGVKEYYEGNDGRSLSGKTYAQDKFAEVALDFIRTNKDRPFFLYLPFIIPHVSVQVPEEAIAKYRGKIPEEPFEQRDNYVKHPTPRAGYAAMVTYLDRDIGRILGLVKELGLDDNTIVIFSSDNGPTHGRAGGSDSEFFKSAGPLRGLKGSLYEGGIRVPLIARWTGKIKPGTTSDHVCAFWDVLPTVAELTGATPPKGIDGLSFAPALLGRAAEQKAHDYLYWEFPSYGGQQAVRMGDWKAVRQKMQQPKNPDPLKIELYNLKDDVGERHDVAAEHPDIVTKAREIMRASHVPSKLFPLVPFEEAPKAKVKKLKEKQ
jgi:arylsulfatase